MKIVGGIKPTNISFQKLKLFSSFWQTNLNLLFLYKFECLYLKREICRICWEKKLSICSFVALNRCSRRLTIKSL